MKEVIKDVESVTSTPAKESGQFVSVSKSHSSMPIEEGSQFVTVSRSHSSMPTGKKGSEQSTGREVAMLHPLKNAEEESDNVVSKTAKEVVDDRKAKIRNLKGSSQETEQEADSQMSLNASFKDSVPENESLIKDFFGISPNNLQDAPPAKKAIYTMVLGVIPQEWRHIYNECLRYASYAGNSITEKVPICKAIRVKTIVDRIEKEYRKALSQLQKSELSDLGLLGTTATFKTLSALGKTMKELSKEVAEVAYEAGRLIRNSAPIPLMSVKMKDGLEWGLNDLTARLRENSKAFGVTLTPDDLNNFKLALAEGIYLAYAQGKFDESYLQTHGGVSGDLLPTVALEKLIQFAPLFARNKREFDELSSMVSMNDGKSKEFLINFMKENIFVGYKFAYLNDE